MKRRADRAIAISAIAAVAVVPTVLLVAVKVGQASPARPGGLPPAAAMATPQPGLSAKSASPATPYGGFTPAPLAPVGPSATPTTPSKPRPTPTTPLKASSYTRLTDIRLTNSATGDTEHGTETAKFVLTPKFAVNSDGVWESTKAGTTTKVIKKAIIKGNVRSDYDGTKWTRRTLTAAELSKERVESDPRMFTFLVKQIPGVKKSPPDKLGSVRYQGTLLVGDVLAYLPQSLAQVVLTFVPADTPINVDLWADKQGRPSWMGATAKATIIDFNATVTFRGYTG